MHALAGGLAALRIARDDDLVAERLHKHFILVAFLVDVADAVFRERAFGDEALRDPFDRHIGWYWHFLLLALFHALAGVDACRHAVTTAGGSASLQLVKVGRKPPLSEMPSWIREMVSAPPARCRISVESSGSRVRLMM